MDHQQLIERFVEALNRRGFEAKFADQVSEELRIREPDDDPEIGDDLELYGWEIRRLGPNGWIASLESRLPTKFPEIFRELIGNYRFAEFEIDPIGFFANMGIAVEQELATSIFCDRYLSPKLLENGFLQFGRWAGGSYDPVCFDMSRRTSTDAPIVLIDHEEILVRDRVKVIKELAPSFRTFAEDVIRQFTSPAQSV